MLDEVVLRKIQSESNSVSAFINRVLRKELLSEQESMLGAFKGRISGFDKIEDDD